MQPNSTASSLLSSLLSIVSFSLLVIIILLLHLHTFTSSYNGLQGKQYSEGYSVPNLYLYNVRRNDPLIRISLFALIFRVSTAVMGFKKRDS